MTLQICSNPTRLSASGASSWCVNPLSHKSTAMRAGRADPFGSSSSRSRSGHLGFFSPGKTGVFFVMRRSCKTRDPSPFCAGCRCAWVLAVSVGVLWDQCVRERDPNLDTCIAVGMDIRDSSFLLLAGCFIPLFESQIRISDLSPLHRTAGSEGRGRLAAVPTCGRRVQAYPLH